MITSSICTIGDEILIGQIVDTNSSRIAQELGNIGVAVKEMRSIADDHNDIITSLTDALSTCDVVITTGGLGPTKDDITKAALGELFGSKRMVEHPGQMAKVIEILHSRGLDILDINKLQAMVPERCEVLVNQFGTAPVMIFNFGAERFGHPATLYALPGVPHEAIGMLPYVMEDIKQKTSLEEVRYRTIMTFGMAESALSKKIEDWEDSLPESMHLAYLPNTLTGVRLRLSVKGMNPEDDEKALDTEIDKLKAIIGDIIYSEQDDTLEGTIGRMLRGTGKTLSCAESCTGGEIAHLITTVSGSSEYFLGSVTSYAVSVKENVLGVPDEVIKEYGLVSSQVASAMAEGVRKLTGSTYAVATTGLAGKEGDEFGNPGGTVWIGVTGPKGTKTIKKQYKNDRIRNIERFAASALDFLRQMIDSDTKSC